MARTSPLAPLHREAEASFAPYGPADASGATIDVVQTYGELELEYAALRKRCVVVDMPQRAVIQVTGKDRLEFLNRMVTQELKDFGPFRVRRSFWLNRKGRIDADLRIVDLPHATYLEMDVHAAARTLSGLAAFVVMEDVTLTDATETLHRLSVHGPTALELFAAAATPTTGAEASGPIVEELTEGVAVCVAMAGMEVVAYREDSAGEVGLELIMPTQGAAAVFQKLLEVGHDPTHGHDAGSALARAGRTRTVAERIGLKPAGWHAYNVARIEAGTPVYNIDFGPESLPAETGVLTDRVSFKKGCYLGQEVVARMHARGHPKQRLVAIAFESRVDQETGFARLPSAGTLVSTVVAGGSGADGGAGGGAGASGAGEGQAVGVITSSTLAPMLSSSPIAFAQVKYASSEAGIVLESEPVSSASGSVRVRGKIRETLRFFSRAEAGGAGGGGQA
jgi:folate-binding protein YgfZ